MQQRTSPLNPINHGHCIQKPSRVQTFSLSNCYLPVIPAQVQQGKCACSHPFCWTATVIFLPKDQLCFTFPCEQKVFQSCRGQQWLLTASHWKPWGSLCPGSYLSWQTQLPSWAVGAEVWSSGAQAETPGEGGRPAAAGEQLFVLATLH